MGPMLKGYRLRHITHNKTWKTILVDLYDQLGQNYVDKILEDYSNSILEEYHVKTRDKYWNSSTLVSSIMSEITYYIKNMIFCQQIIRL